MYAEHRFDQLTAPPTHFLDGFIDYLRKNVKETYQYANANDCLNCRWHKTQGKEYRPPGTVSKMLKPSEEYVSRVIETIAADSAPTLPYGDFDVTRPGTYSKALEMAEYVRQHDAWPEKVEA